MICKEFASRCHANQLVFTGIVLMQEINKFLAFQEFEQNKKSEDDNLLCETKVTKCLLLCFELNIHRSFLDMLALWKSTKLCLFFP